MNPRMFNEVLSHYIAAYELLDENEKKMAKLMKHLESPEAREEYLEAYEAMIHFRQLKETLKQIKPRLEIL